MSIDPKNPDSGSRDPSDLEILPVLPLRNAVLYPAQVVPINVGRPRSVRLIEELFGRERPYVAIVAQRRPDIEEPTFKDLFEVGVLAKIVKVIRMSAGSYSVVLQGASRMRILEPLGLEPYMRARVQRLHDRLDRDVELDALGTTLRETTREVLELDARTLAPLGSVAGVAGLDARPTATTATTSSPRPLRARWPRRRRRTRASSPRSSSTRRRPRSSSPRWPRPKCRSACRKRPRTGAR